MNGPASNAVRRFRRTALLLAEPLVELLDALPELARVELPTPGRSTFFQIRIAVLGLLVSILLLNLPQQLGVR